MNKTRGGWLLLVALMVLGTTLQAQFTMDLEYLGSCGLVGTTDKGVLPLGIENCGDERLFIVRQRGYVEVMFPDGSVQDRPFLNIADRIFNNDDRGLLALCFHPRYEENGFFFVNYTRKEDGAVVIARFSVDPAHPEYCDSSSETVLMVVSEPIGNHNGGGLAFGPDGMLYIGLGDGGCCGDPLDYARNIGVPLGKILRIDVDHEDEGKTYAVPKDNPFVTRPDALPEVWAYGLRNPWRISFDKVSHDLFIADVGQDHFEELNIQAQDSRGGENYGWSAYEASSLFNPSRFDSAAVYTPPVVEYEHAEGGGQCIVGGYVYHGWRFPSFLTKYYFCDFTVGTFFELDRAFGQHVVSKTTPSVKHENRFACFGQDAFGELYTADIQNGKIYKVVDTACHSPAVQFEGVADTVKVDAGAVRLNATPFGGRFIGAGVEGLYFYPQLAGVGRHCILYQYTPESGGCGAQAVQWIEVTFSTLSDAHESEPEQISWSVRPNPAHDYLHCEIPTATRLMFVDARGSIVVEHNVPAGSSNIDIRALCAGEYHIILEHFGSRQCIVQ